MLTPYDVQALIDLLQRVPMTKPEMLYTQNVVARLTQWIEESATNTEHEEKQEDHTNSNEAPPPLEPDVITPLQPDPLLSY